MNIMECNANPIRMLNNPNYDYTSTDYAEAMLVHMNRRDKYHNRLTNQRSYAQQKVEQKRPTYVLKYNRGKVVPIFHRMPQKYAFNDYEEKVWVRTPY